MCRFLKTLCWFYVAVEGRSFDKRAEGWWSEQNAYFKHCQVCEKSGSMVFRGGEAGDVRLELGTVMLLLHCFEDVPLTVLLHLARLMPLTVLHRSSLMTLTVFQRSRLMALPLLQR